MHDRILVVDANSLGTRAFYISDTSFFSMVGTVMHEVNPDYVIFAFDSANNFRKQLYPDYKATRKPKSVEELNLRNIRIDYLRHLWTVLKSAGFITLCADGYEADDVIASVVTQFVAEHYVLSGDKDLLQLADRATVVYCPSSFNNRVFCGINECVEITGYTPDQLVLYKALVGEATDNIPGVPKIGPVAASKLLPSTYIELLNNERVAANKRLFELSYTLATLVTDIDLDFNWRTGDLELAQQLYLRKRL